MHYYQFNIADYRKDTAHLSLIEHAIYRQLLDWYYLDERPIPAETHWVIRRFQIPHEQVETILKEFFELRSDGWHHSRCDIEINNYKHNAEKNRRNGKLGGRPKKTQSVNLANPNETQEKPTGNPSESQPVTNNQEPITKRKSKADTATASRLPADWSPTEADQDFCRRERPDLDCRSVADRFRDHWISKPGADGRKLDWSATWRNWVRRESAQPRASPRQTVNDQRTETIEYLTGRSKNERTSNPERDITGEAVRVA